MRSQPQPPATESGSGSSASVSELRTDSGEATTLIWPAGWLGSRYSVAFQMTPHLTNHDLPYEAWQPEKPITV